MACPECRRIQPLKPPWTVESINKELITNAVMLPKKQKEGDELFVKEANNADVYLLPEQAEIEERIPTLGVDDVRGKKFSLKTYACRRCCAYVWVLIPIMISVLCQPITVN